MAYDITEMIIWVVIFVIVWKVVDAIINLITKEKNEKSFFKRKGFWLSLVLIGVYIWYVNGCAVAIESDLGKICLEEREDKIVKPFLNKVKSMGFLSENMENIKKLNRTEMSEEKKQSCDYLVPETIEISNYIETQYRALGAFNLPDAGTRNFWLNDYATEPPLGEIGTMALTNCDKGDSIGKNINHVYCHDIDASKRVKEINKEGVITKDEVRWYKVFLELSQEDTHHFKIVDFECARKK